MRHRGDGGVGRGWAAGGAAMAGAARLVEGVEEGGRVLEEVQARRLLAGPHAVAGKSNASNDGGFYQRRIGSTL